MPLREPIAALFIFAFSLGAFLLAGNFQNGAEIFPRGIAVVMLVGSVILFARGILRPSAADPGEPSRVETVRILISAMLTVAYMVLIVPLGFVTSSLIYIPVSAYVLGLRNHLAIWLTSLLFVGFIYLFFEMIFHTPLPQEAVLHVFSAR